MRILITGSAGLVGASMQEWARRQSNIQIATFDVRDSAAEDVRNIDSLRECMAKCEGVIHLAAISRVVWSERDPELCWATNVGGTLNVLRAAVDARRRPWLLFASSREVYGQPSQLPATEDTRREPINVYGRAKLEAERLFERARADGLQTAIVRLSNVYGRTDDHRDRVIPAFCHGAATRQPLRIDGRSHVFDFTHVRDTVEGLGAVVGVLAAGERSLPPIHLLTGQPTTLLQLAELANAAADGRCELIDGTERSYDVARFWGDPGRARELLGWGARISIAEGVRELVGRFANSERGST